MTILLRVVDTGSFSAASRELGVPLATVSRKVGELEAHLGTRLLTRTTRKVTMTDAGAAYVVSARRILNDVDETERVAAGEFHAPRGELVVTAPILFGRLEINVRLVLADRNLHLLDDQVDMAVRIGDLPDSSMVATRIGSMRTVVCASPKLLAAHGIPRAPEDLAGLPSVSFRPGGKLSHSQAVSPHRRPKLASGFHASESAPEGGRGVGQHGCCRGRPHWSQSSRP